MPAPTLRLAARPPASPIPAVIAFLLVPMGWILLAAQTPERHYALLQEGGLLETTSAALYFVAAAVLLPKLRRIWPFFVIVLAFALRELDFDKLLFTEGLFKSRQYVGDTVGGVERVVSSVILLGLLVAGVTAARRGMRGLRRRIAQADGVALSVLLGLFLLATSKVADGLGRKLADFGITLSAWGDLQALAYEELAETVASLAILLAAYGFMKALGAAAPDPATADLEGVNG